MNESPLAILGLSREGASVPAIKAAYARLLKEHRPDVDPEGFKRLRTAYELALSGCEPLTAQPDAASATAQESPAQNRPNVTAGTQAALVALREAVESRARQRVRDCWAKLDVEAAYLGLRERFHLAMEAFNKAPITLLSDVCTDERLLAHLQDGDVQLTHAALKGWTAQRDVRRIRDFIASLNRARDLHSLPECAVVMVWTAVAMAAWEPETANRLAQKAFPVLPPQNRAELIQRADLEISYGRLVSALPETDKIFWLACLRGQPPSTAWGDMDGRKLLSNLLRHCGPKWPGLDVLSTSLPEEQWKRLVAALKHLS